MVFLTLFYFGIKIVHFLNRVVQSINFWFGQVNVFRISQHCNLHRFDHRFVQNISFSGIPLNPRVTFFQ